MQRENGHGGWKPPPRWKNWPKHWPYRTWNRMFQGRTRTSSPSHGEEAASSSSVSFRRKGLLGGESFLKESAPRGRIALPELKRWARCPRSLKTRAGRPCPSYKEAASSRAHQSPISNIQSRFILRAPLRPWRLRGKSFLKRVGAARPHRPTGENMERDAPWTAWSKMLQPLEGELLPSSPITPNKKPQLFRSTLLRRSDGLDDEL